MCLVLDAGKFLVSSLRVASLADFLEPRYPLGVARRQGAVKYRLKGFIIYLLGQVMVAAAVADRCSTKVRWKDALGDLRFM